MNVIAMASITHNFESVFNNYQISFSHEFENISNYQLLLCWNEFHIFVDTILNESAQTIVWRSDGAKMGKRSTIL